MARYKVELGALVTKLMKRTFYVSAPDEQTAIERAENRFRYACSHNSTYTDCDSIELDHIEKLED